MSRISEKIIDVQTRLVNATSITAQEAIPPLLLAVSTTRDTEQIRKAYACGLMHFGENYLQEAAEKIEALRDLNLTWHFIGAMQSNKTKEIARHFDWVHTLDRLKIAQRLSKQRPPELDDLNLLIQINIDAETSKAGIHPNQLDELANQVSDLPNIRLRGLMAIPAPRESFDAQLEVCRKIHSHFIQLQQHYPEVDTLSMGMSGDLEAAVQAGSTLVRIGTDIFGPRN